MGAASGQNGRWGAPGARALEGGALRVSTHPGGLDSSRKKAPEVGEKFFGSSLQQQGALGTGQWLRAQHRPWCPWALPLTGSTAPAQALTLCCRREDGGSRATGFSPRSRSDCSCRSRLRPRSQLREEPASSWAMGGGVTGGARGYKVRAKGRRGGRPHPGCPAMHLAVGCLGRVGEVLA